MFFFVLLAHPAMDVVDKWLLNRLLYISKGHHSLMLPFNVTVLCRLHCAKMVPRVKKIVWKRSSVQLEKSVEVTARGNLGQERFSVEYFVTLMSTDLKADSALTLFVAFRVLGIASLSHFSSFL